MTPRQSSTLAPRQNSTPAPPQSSTLALRMAHPEDDRDVRRLAALDSSSPLEEPVMLALVDGEAVAAVSLSDERVVANPFLPTADAVALLDMRIAQLRRPRLRRRIVWPPRLRAA
jgi:hypothetical protein